MRHAKLLAALLLLAPATASAFCRTTVETAAPRCDGAGGSPVLYWASKCAGFLVQSESTTATPDPLGAIDQAFLAWQGKLCGTGELAESPSMKLLVFGAQSKLRVGYQTNGPNQNVIVFGPRQGQGNRDEQLSLSMLTFSKTTGEILDADLEIFDDNTPFAGPSAFDLASVLTHESGHLLGLAHSEDAEATMFASASPGEVNKRTLASDDAQAVCAAYPPNGTRVTSAGTIPATACNLQPGLASACSPSVRGGCSLAPRTGEGAASLALVVAACALALRRKRAPQRSKDAR
jgi:hypothetical protein